MNTTKKLQIHTSIEFFTHLREKGVVKEHGGRITKGNFEGATLWGIITFGQENDWDWAGFLEIMYEELGIHTGYLYLYPELDKTVTMHPGQNEDLINALMPLMPFNTTKEHLIGILELFA